MRRWLSLAAALCLATPAFAYQGTPDGSSLWQSPTTGQWSVVGANSAFFVATNGNDANAGSFLAPFATLGKCQSAMQASVTTKTCFVRAGTYSPSPVTVGSNTYALYLTQADTGEAWSVYIPDGYDTAIIDGGSTSTATGINEGIVIEGGSNITINGLQAQRFGWVGIGIHGGTGQYAVFPSTAPYAYNNLIENNIVHDIHGAGGSSFGYAGIVCGFVSAPFSTCANNVVYNTDTDGIRFNAGGAGIGGVLTGMQIVSNVVYKALNSSYTDGGCIYYQDNNATSRDIVIAYNMLHDCGTGTGDSSIGIYLDDGASNVSIIGNVIAGLFGWAVQAHEGQNISWIGNIIDLGAGGNQYQFVQQMSNNTQGDQHGFVFANNLIIGKHTGTYAGYYAGAGSTIVNPAWINQNAYYDYAGGTIRTTCTGNTGNGCPQDANPKSGSNPALTGCYQLPSGGMQQVTSYTGGFVAARSGGWGPPGYTLPVTGTAPSYPSPTCW